MTLFSSRRLRPGFLLLSLAPFSTCLAQSKAAPKPKVVPRASAAPIFSLDALPIATPPQVPVEFEFVGTQKDLLGVVQAMASGASGTGNQPASPDMNKRAQIISDADLLAILRDIHFLRVQSFNFLKMEQKQDEERAKTPKPAGSPQNMSDFEDSMNPKRPKRIDVQEFYSRAFRAQKGQRQFFSSAGDLDGDHGGDTTISIWRFNSPSSWALVTQGPTRAIVVRADGLPRPEVLGRLFKLAVSKR